MKSSPSPPSPRVWEDPPRCDSVEDGLRTAALLDRNRKLAGIPWKWPKNSGARKLITSATLSPAGRRRLVLDVEGALIAPRCPNGTMSPM